MYWISPCSGTSSSSGGSDLSLFIFADNDGDALALGVALNGWYKASNTNTMGLPIGTLKQLVGLS